MSVYLMLAIFLLLANLPWIGERIFLVFAMQRKPVWIRLLEFLIYYLVMLLVAIGFELRFSGEVYSQDWEFFVTTFCIFVVLSVPGVVYRYQWLPIQEKFK